MAIGFKYWGSGVSKWEKSMFGGYYRLIADYPRVVIDWSVDFDFAKIKKLSYYEKEKILKIFLSKVKSNGLVFYLLQNTKSVSEVNFSGKKIIRTIINKESTRLVLNTLVAIEKEMEYEPLFNHYKYFIIDTEISFKSEQQCGGSESDDLEDNDSNEAQENEHGENNDRKDNDGKNKSQKKQNSKSDKSDDDGDRNDEDDDSNKNNDLEEDLDDVKNGKSNSDKKKQIPQHEIERNLNEFNDALNDVHEEELKFDSLSTFHKKTKIKIQKPNSSETRIDHTERNIADNLTKLLDISFDPTEDIVKNLRLGKLDVSKIAEVPAGNISIYKQSVENQTTKPFSVVILCDESGSMQEESRIYHQYHMVKSLYLSFSDILPQDKIFVYGHSGSYDPELFVYQDAYNPNFLTTIDRMLTPNRWQQNYDGPIIEQIHKSVRAVTSDRIIFIVLSDGYPCGNQYGAYSDIINMKQIIEKCKRDDFVTVGVGIQCIVTKDLYKYSAVVNDLNDMPKKVSHIVNHVVKTEFQ